MTELTQIDGQRAPEAKLRADAAHNRDRILTAARDLFAERGIDVPMTAIARRAGVGAATLFRRFPDRRSLITEVFDTQLTHCEAVLTKAAADPDPWRGFCTFITDLGRMQIEDRGFTEAFLSAFADDAGIDEKRTHAEAVFADLVDRAQKAGGLRPDFSPSDLMLIFLANGGVSEAPPEHAQELSRRLIAYLLQSFEANDQRAQRPLPRPSNIGLSEVLAAPM